MTTLLASALELARLGFRVLPVIGNTKQPAIKAWPTKATTDISTIERWFASSNYNIGVATGQESNLLVLDIDRHPGRANGIANFTGICRNGGDPPRGPVARTAGNGVHFFYAYPRSATTLPKSLAPGIDILGEGRFVVVSPSAVHGKSYRWEDGLSPAEVELADCGNWLGAAMALETPQQSPSALLLPDRPATFARVNGDAAARVDLRIQPPDTPEAVEQLRTALVVIPPCLPYDEWIRILFSVKAHQFGDGERIAREWSARCIENYDEAAFCRAWNSDRGYGIGPGTVYRVAQDHGWLAKAESKATAIQTLGDVNNGREFAKSLRGQLLYCHAANKWLYWTGQRWDWCDDGREMQGAKSVADRILDDAAKAFKADPNDSRIKALMQAAKLLHGNESRLIAMLSMASTEEGMSIPSPAALDSDPWMLGVRNGVVDLRSGKLLSAAPSMLISRQCDANFDEGAAAPRFEKFMQEVFQGDAGMIEYMQRQLGYALTGLVREEALFFWFGRGANGKSVLANIIAAVVGNYGGYVSPDLLRAGREAKGNAERATLRLGGLRVVFMNELAEGETWNDGRLREITSREKISARYLYGEMFEFLPTHKLFVRGNNKPAIRDGTDGTWRRIQLVGFNRQFSEAERTVDLDVRILQEERDGILGWLVRGCLLWQREGLCPPKSVRAAVNEYRKDCDVIEEWMEACCQVNSDYSAEKQGVYQNYKFWTSENGLRPLSGKALSRRLGERGFELDKGRRKYSGFKLATGRPAPE